MKMVMMALVSLVATTAMASVKVGPACTPGTSAFLSELQPNGKYTQVFKTCGDNGRFYADEAAPVVLKCQDGQVANFQEATSNGRWVTVARVCKDGRYYPKAVVTPLTCKEGSQAIFSQLDVSGRSFDVTKTCVNGKWN